MYKCIYAAIENAAAGPIAARRHCAKLCNKSSIYTSPSSISLCLSVVLARARGITIRSGAMRCHRLRARPRTERREEKKRGSRSRVCVRNRIIPPLALARAWQRESSRGLRGCPLADRRRRCIGRVSSSIIGNDESRARASGGRGQGRCLR